MWAGKTVGRYRGYKLTLGCCLLAFTLFIDASIVSAQTIDCNAQFYPGHILVRFKATTTAGAQQMAHAAVAAATGGGVQVLTEFHVVTGLQLVEVAVGQEQAAITAYGNDPGVEYAEPD